MKIKVSVHPHIAHSSSVYTYTISKSKSSGYVEKVIFLSELFTYDFFVAKRCCRNHTNMYNGVV